MAEMITEPTPATKEQIDAMNPSTHKLVTLRAGMKDGTIKDIIVIKEKTEDEKGTYRRNQIKERIIILRDKLLDKTITDKECADLELLLKIF